MILSCIKDLSLASPAIAHSECRPGLGIIIKTVHFGVTGTRSKMSIFTREYQLAYAQ